MAYFQLTFYFLMLLFWARLWTWPTEFSFNPFVSGPVQWTDQVLGFLRPVLCLPEQAAAAIVVLFLFVFQGLLLFKTGFHPAITIGSVFTFVPPAVEGNAGMKAFFTFGALGAGMFLLRVWAAFMLVRLFSIGVPETRAMDAFGFFARPFSRLKWPFQLIALVVLQGALVLALAHFGVLQIPKADDAVTAAKVLQPPGDLFANGMVLVRMIRIGWLTALSMADALLAVNRAMLVLVLANFVCAILQWPAGVLLSNEGVNLLLGRFAGHHAEGMGLDFRPLIFFVAVNLAYGVVSSFLAQMIISFPGKVL